MKKFTLTFTILCALCALAYTGTERYSGKEKEIMQPGPPPCDFFRAHEWDFDFWGAYAFPGNTGSNHDPSDFRPGEFENVPEDSANDPDQFVDIGHVSHDRFLNRDGAWGGGADIKFFFSKYWALGVEGFVLDANDNIAGAGLGTFTFRWPIGCSRFAPYAFAGFGGAGGGSHTSRFFYEIHFDPPRGPNLTDEIEYRADQTFQNKHTEMIGQFGAGLEIRITRHIGVMSDFSWNVLSDPDNDFGMGRFGVTLSY
jgi:hypothetical protein